MRYRFNKLIPAIGLMMISAFSNAQVDNNATLFTVGGEPVKVGEFKFIYEKNNGSKADYSEKSLKEYLALYKKYKLKVRKAKEMGLDKDENLKKELDGYRRQLSSSYLTDREIIEKLVREAYQNSKQDVHISHILIPVKGSDPSLDAAALAQAKDLATRLTTSNFAEMAKTNSQDPGSAANGGDVGYFTVFQLPYPMEKAIYAAKAGDIIGPVRTPFGYHLIWVMDYRAARGQVQGSHILLRTKAGDAERNKMAKMKIDSAYQKLKAGEKWEALVAKYSEDNVSKSKEGNIGWFGINKYDESFENAIFGLKADGEYSQPIQTSSGWHIVRRIKVLVNPTYEEAKAELINKVKKDSRFEEVQKVLVAKIKNEAGYKINEAAKSGFMKTLNNDFLTFKWKAPKQDSFPSGKEVLFTVGDRNITLYDFAIFAERNPMERTQNKGPASDPIGAAIDRLLEKNVAQTCMTYEESKLSDKYPDYRALMREYEEGIILFEATKKEVWDKASTDEKGLNAYYEKNKNKYMWGEKYKITTYTVKSKDEKQIAEVRKKAEKKGPADVVAAFNKKDNEVVTYDESTIEKSRNEALKAAKEVKKGMLIDTKAKGEGVAFIKVEGTQAPTNKTLQEARGYVVADYQDYLAEQWVSDLAKAFPIEENKEVISKLIKK